MQVAAPTNKLHPLIATAAVAVTAVSVLGAVVLVTTQVSAHHATPETAIAAATLAAVPATQPAAAVQGRQAAEPAPVYRAPRPVTTAMNTPARPPVTRDVPASPVTETPKPAAPARSAVPVEPVVQAPPAPAICSTCGVVSSVREIKAPGEASGIGAIAGGVLGGVLGNQIGKGSGRDATRILGAIGGAVAGHQIEKRTRATTSYEVTVRMDDGSLRTLTRTTDPGVRSGDRIHLDGERIINVDGRAIAPTPAPASVAPRVEA